MKNNPSTFQVIVMVSCLIALIQLVIMAIIYKSEFEYLKKIAVETGHAEYVANPDGNPVFMWKKIP